MCGLCPKDWIQHIPGMVFDSMSEGPECMRVPPRILTLRLMQACFPWAEIAVDMPKVV